MIKTVWNSETGVYEMGTEFVVRFSKQATDSITGTADTLKFLIDGRPLYLEPYDWIELCMELRTQIETCKRFDIDFCPSDNRDTVLSITTVTPSVVAISILYQEDEHVYATARTLLFKSTLLGIFYSLLEPALKTVISNYESSDRIPDL